MMQKRKNLKPISVMLTLVILVGVLQNIGALTCNAVTPRWVSINAIELNMSFDGSYGNALGTASKQSTATSIEGTLTLYKLVDDDWVYMDEWYNSKTRGTLAVTGDFTCESGVTYKAVFVVTVYTGTTAETETVEHIDECP